MRASLVSTASLVGTPRASVSRMQNDLVRLNQEVTTSRLADVGLTLGARTSQSVSLHIDNDALSALIDGNSAVSARLQQQQTALDSMRSGANDFLQALVGAETAGNGGTVAQTARSALASFTQAANVSDGRNYLFGGINSGEAPLADYDSGPGAAVEAAFTAKFGFAPSDPAAANITGAEMSDFLDNEFGALFSDPGWGATWSSASDQTVSNRIDTGTTVSTSVSANESAMRKLAEAYTAVGYLGFDGLGDDAKKAILDKANALTGDGSDGLVAIQADLGGVQNQVTDSSDRLKTQQTILQTHIDSLEGVDAAEAKVKIDTLTTQIEMSYSLTAKLLQMSLLNYA
jgi:flagellar hook-associated protein 3 FlgL